MFSAPSGRSKKTCFNFTLVWFYKKKSLLCFDEKCLPFLTKSKTYCNRVAIWREKNLFMLTKIKTCFNFTRKNLFILAKKTRKKTCLVLTRNARFFWRIKKLLYWSHCNLMRKKNCFVLTRTKTWFNVRQKAMKKKPCSLLKVQVREMKPHWR